MQTSKNENAVIYCDALSFNASDKQLSPVLINNQPYFVAVEVCEILDLKNPTDRLKSLDEDEKLTYELHRSGQRREVNLVNESGLYNLIFRSNKPEAKAFRKWVTSEVLPSLRKTGTYAIEPNLPLKPIDLRSLPFETYEYNNVLVRGIEYDDVIWYSINDLNKAIGARTNAYQLAKMLNNSSILARKIHVFGNTHPAWFTTMRGVKLIKSGSRVVNCNSKQLGAKQLSLNLGGR